MADLGDALLVSGLAVSALMALAFVGSLPLRDVSIVDIAWAITMDDRAYHVEKASRSFIRTFIFPNGCLPSMEIISRNIARRTDMRMTGLQDLTSHYPETLRRWRANFEAHADELATRGYDERFRRIWRLYLSYCEAGFAGRRISVLQLRFSKPQHSPEQGAMPLVRDLAAAS